MSAQGEPLVEPVIGPKLICFKYSTFLLGEGESIAGLSGSPEGLQVEVEGPLGKYDIGESEIYAAPNGKKLVFSKGDTRVYRVPGDGSNYAIYGPTDFSEGDQPVIGLSGAALHGTANDRSIFSRFDVRDPRSVQCERTFTYSWGL